jgi:hypothetical protein
MATKKGRKAGGGKGTGGGVAGRPGQSKRSGKKAGGKGTGGGQAGSKPGGSSSRATKKR